jgi:hypothetical protein
VWISGRRRKKKKEKSQKVLFGHCRHSGILRSDIIISQFRIFYLVGDDFSGYRWMAQKPSAHPSQSITTKLTRVATHKSDFFFFFDAALTLIRISYFVIARRSFLLLLPPEGIYLPNCTLYTDSKVLIRRCQLDINV